jgi:uncharacterized membrane protein YhaH (DUF805 family)
MNSALISTIINTYKKSFAFQGRASRRELWLWFFFLNTFAAVSVIHLDPFEQFNVIPTILPRNLPPYSEGCFFIILFLIPSYSIMVRRFHDLGLSGWLIPLMVVLPSILLFLACPEILFFILASFPDILFFILDYFLFLNPLLLYILFNPGDKEGNRYGPATIDPNLSLFDKICLNVLTPIYLLLLLCMLSIFIMGVLIATAMSNT